MEDKIQNGEVFLLNLGMNAILLISDRDVQKWLSKISNSDLVIALKGTSRDVQEKVYKNMSHEAREFLKEDFEYSGTQFKSVVQEKQTQILNVLKGLARVKEIVIPYGKTDFFGEGIIY